MNLTLMHVSSDPIKSVLARYGTSQVITWNMQGDYHPYLEIQPIDPNQKLFPVQYSDLMIHVDGSDAIQQEQYTKITTVLTIVLLVFTFISVPGVMRGTGRPLPLGRG